MLRNFFKVYEKITYHHGIIQAPKLLASVNPQINRFFLRNFSSEHANEDDIEYPNYKERSGEGEEEIRRRLVYQSRKRGTLEVGLLLSTFASKHLASMNLEQLLEYDKLINVPQNEWDIYYWLTGTKSIPDEFKCPTMELLIEFSKNKEKEIRITQPSLYE